MSDDDAKFELLMARIEKLADKSFGVYDPDDPFSSAFLDVAEAQIELAELRYSDTPAGVIDAAFKKRVAAGKRLMAVLGKEKKAGAADRLEPRPIGLTGTTNLRHEAFHPKTPPDPAPCWG